MKRALAGGAYTQIQETNAGFSLEGERERERERENPEGYQAWKGQSEVYPVHAASICNY